MTNRTTHAAVSTQEMTPVPQPGVPVHITPHPKLMDPGGPGARISTLQGEIAHRLEWTALLFASVYLVVHLVGRVTGVYEAMDGYNPTLANIVVASVVSISVATYWVARRRLLAPATMENLALGFEVVAALGIEVFLTWLPIGDRVEALRVSWVTVWILFIAVVVPTAPRKQWIGAVATALTTPAMLGIGIWRGISAPSFTVVLPYVFPNFVAVVFSIVGARIIYRMRQQVQEARAMGSYRLVEQLGYGGMGEVWRAEHSRLARPAAIKLIRPEAMGRTSGTNTIFQRFEREAQVTATLESMHTVTLYDFGISDDGAFYYVMELLHGLDLERLVERFGPLPPRRVAYLLRQACHSLEEAHLRGLIHRDIKPANLYVCRWGLDFDFVKVLDFGLARPMHPGGEDLQLTQAGTAAGTPAYMAPELVMAKPDVDARADIYSLGCVAFFLLTGRLVFEAPTVMAIAAHHAQTQPRKPSQVAAQPIPEPLDRLVLTCLEKDPRRRPQTMTELASLLASTVEEPWNPAEARAWWQAHLPSLIRELPRPDSYAMR